MKVWGGEATLLTAFVFDVQFLEVVNTDRKRYRGRICVIGCCHLDSSVKLWPLHNACLNSLWSLLFILARWIIQIKQLFHEYGWCHKRPKTGCRASKKMGFPHLNINTQKNLVFHFVEGLQSRRSNDTNQVKNNLLCRLSLISIDSLNILLT